MVIAPSLCEAREQLRAGAFDAVLVDFDLDDGKGDVLVRELKDTRFSGRIVGISSHEQGNAALLAAGAHASCPKSAFAHISERLRWDT